MRSLLFMDRISLPTGHVWINLTDGELDSRPTLTGKPYISRGEPRSRATIYATMGYTVDHIMTVLHSLFPESFPSLRDAFFRMLVFDAFIGAPDRHAMNWGVVAPLEENAGRVRYAPIYDTARGLFREMSDVDLQGKILRQGKKNFFRSYAERSFPVIGTGEDERRNHFSLIRWVSNNYHDVSQSSIHDMLNSINMRRTERMLQMRFRRIVTQVRIGAITDLLTYRLERLRKEVKL